MNGGERRRGGDRRKLTGAQRAAALLIVLGNGAAPKLLQHLDKDEVRQIAGAAATLGIVDRMSLDNTIDEFARDLAEGPEIVGTLSGAQQLVAGSLAPQEVAQIVEGESEDATIDAWAQLDKLADHDVAALLSKEPPAISATILRKVAPDRAAGVLAQIDNAHRPEIVAYMLISPAASDVAMSLLEASVGSVLGQGDRTTGAGETRARVADVVNRLDGSAIDDVIAYLSAVAPELAAEIKPLVFKFEQLGELSQQDRITVLDGVPTERVILALKGAAPDVVEATLSSLGGRARRLVESELANDSTAPLREAQAARRMIVQETLRLSALGSITVPASAAAE